MAKLSTAARKKLPAKSFALPGRRFPVNDAAHAVAAERLVGRPEKAGSISPEQAETVKHKAAAKLAGQRPSPASLTHDQGGMEHDRSMKPFHHNVMQHTSKDR